ncbi:SDR family oxidoreductase [Marinomonas mediterranea]|uniref:SDR family oxidoreductase n=1 Tax=Marinomonas mediterranea TaxID=119864 RepID=UPI0023495895|nr:SDR family oxidoreductase [Marinomonas mediterranea]WCN12957.1 SDR family oxidoreductase [Marinomonas mediterranea]
MQDFSVNAAKLFDLTGRVAFVTGAGSGIGQCIAHALASAGAKVTCFDMREDGGLSDTLKSIQSIGGEAIACTGDVCNVASLEAAISQTEAAFGRLDIAVNAAGIANANPALAMEPVQWQKVIDINLTGVWNSCKAEAALMEKSGGGSIVNIGSMSGVIVNRGLEQAHYNTSKAGVIHMTKSLAMEWVDKKIRVNSISPGYTATPMNTRPEMVHQTIEFEGQTPMGRMARVDEMAGPAIFLASDAASYCTGVDLLVDGGFVCW